ncbi:tyrosine-type recombinase/integrase [Streptomyces gardneri]|uniref:tyrosine-type recombinase/integrase n=1 Tax=Streptomyces gardneri TaxID=66892 RepID=UPI0037D6DA99
MRYRDTMGRQRAESFDRKPDAEKRAAEIAVELGRGTYVDPKAGNTLFNVVAAQWRAQRIYRPNSALKVDGVFRLYIDPSFQHRPVGKITTDEIRAWLASDRMANLSPASRHTALGYLHSVLHKAIEDGLINRDPSSPVKVNGGKHKPIDRVLSSHEVSLLIKAAPDELRPVVMLAAGTGLRLGEVLGLAAQDVDLERNLLHVRQQWLLKQGELGPLKTESSRRTVPLADVLVTMLRPLVESAESSSAPHLLFTLGRRVEGMWAKAIKDAGVAARFHDLRHHFASVLIGSGADVKAVQKILGHTSAAMTLDTYAHYFHGTADDTVRAAIQGSFGQDHEPVVHPDHGSEA